jgi:hypothetical protein
MFWCSGVTTIFTAIFGVIGNLLSILVLSQKSMTSVFNHLLLSLCLSDLVFLLSNLSMSPVMMHYFLYPAHLYHASECLCHVALATSIFLTTSLSIERYQAVCFPHSYQYRLAKTGHKLLIAYYVLPAIILGCLLNIPR